MVGQVFRVSGADEFFHIVGEAGRIEVFDISGVNDLVNTFPFLFGEWFVFADDSGHLL